MPQGIPPGAGHDPVGEAPVAARAEGFLKPGITFEQLDALAHSTTSLDAAQEVQRARKALFQLIAKALNPAA